MSKFLRLLKYSYYDSVIMLVYLTPKNFESHVTVYRAVYKDKILNRQGEINLPGVSIRCNYRYYQTAAILGER